jgi:hypothetical protein
VFSERTEKATNRDLGAPNKRCKPRVDRLYVDILPVSLSEGLLVGFVISVPYTVMQTLFPTGLSVGFLAVYETSSSQLH